MNSVSSSHSITTAINHTLANNLTFNSQAAPSTASNVPTPNNARSMSIISIESPRNSIVSIDENMIRPTRNNSNSSLASLNSHPATPLNPHMLHHTPPIIPGDYISKLSHKNSSVVLSDDDSEVDTALPPPSRLILKPIFRLKRHPDLDQTLKKDFKFKYKDLMMHTASSSSSSSSSPALPVQSSPGSGAAGLMQPHAAHQTPTGGSIDSIPSPLSLNNSNKPHDVDHEQTNPKALKKNKVVPSSMQKLYLKKIYSKDLQIELAGNVTSPISNPLTYGFPEVATSSKKPPSPSSLSPPALHPSTLIEQNKLINDLNRKWNKSVINADIPDKLKKSLPMLLPSASRKRSRRFSFSEDDTYDDDDFYDSYDFYNKAFTTSYDLNYKNDEPIILERIQRNPETIHRPLQRPMPGFIIHPNHHSIDHHHHQSTNNINHIGHIHHMNPNTIPNNSKDSNSNSVKDTQPQLDQKKD